MIGLEGVEGSTQILVKPLFKMALILFLSVFLLGCPLTDSKQLEYLTLEMLETDLQSNLSEGNSTETVRAYLSTKDFECSEIESDVLVTCSAPIPPTNFWTSRKWLMELQMSGGRLQKISVTEGLIAF